MPTLVRPARNHPRANGTRDTRMRHMPRHRSLNARSHSCSASHAHSARRQWAASRGKKKERPRPLAPPGAVSARLHGALRGSGSQGNLLSDEEEVLEQGLGHSAGAACGQRRRQLDVDALRLRQAAAAVWSAASSEGRGGGGRTAARPSAPVGTPAASVCVGGGGRRPQASVAQARARTWKKVRRTNFYKGATNLLNLECKQ
jgi:hypothetical protein